MGIKAQSDFAVLWTPQRIIWQLAIGGPIMEKQKLFDEHFQFREAFYSLVVDYADAVPA